MTQKLNQNKRYILDAESGYVFDRLNNEWIAEAEAVFLALQSIAEMPEGAAPELQAANVQLREHGGGAGASHATQPVIK